MTRVYAIFAIQVTQQHLIKLFIQTWLYA